MRILYFGDYDPAYARNRVILRGLRQSGVDVTEVNTRAKGLEKYRELLRKFRAAGRADLVMVGHSDSRWMVPFVRCLTSTPIVWDAFYSIYGSWAFDKRIIRPRGIRAFYYWALEWLNIRLANRVVLDTDAHIGYFVRVFRAPRARFIRVFIGADDSVFYPSA